MYRALFVLLVACTQSTSVTSARTDARSKTLETLSASIDTPSGKVLALAGKASLSATNTWLSGKHFVAGYPEGFPSSYWGLSSSTDAYVFLTATSYPDSTWTLDNNERTGAYASFEVTIWGFATDNNGDPIGDWTTYTVQQSLTGTDTIDTAELVDFYWTVFGSSATGADIAMSNDDGNGYLDTATVNTTGVVFTVGEENSHRCTHQTAEYGTCWYWNDQVYTGTDTTAVGSWSFRHYDNNWLGFDSGTDTFSVSDTALAGTLSSISFAPLFWVRANDSSFDFAN